MIKRIMKVGQRFLQNSLARAKRLGLEQTQII